MKRKIIEALLPFVMYLLEHWPKKVRPSVMTLPNEGPLKRFKKHAKALRPMKQSEDRGINNELSYLSTSIRTY